MNLDSRDRSSVSRMLVLLSCQCFWALKKDMNIGTRNSFRGSVSGVMMPIGRPHMDISS